MRRSLIPLLAASVLGLGLWWLNARDPEHRDLDDAARADAPGRFVALPDGRTHVVVSGPDTGTRVLLVHGFSVPGYIWDSTAIALSGAGYQVARYDTYGRGYSDRPDATYDYALYERQLLGVLDSLGWTTPVHLVGLSFGGPVASYVTARNPERVRTLTLVDPAAGPAGTLPWFTRMPWLGEKLWQALAVPEMADGQAADFLEPSRWPDWADRYRVQMQFRGFGRALLRTRLATDSVLKDSIFTAAGATRTPAMLLWGEGDQVVPIDRATGVVRAFPGIQFHIIEKAAHLPQMEKAGQVNALLHAFFSTHGANP